MKCLLTGALCGRQMRETYIKAGPRRLQVKGPLLAMYGVYIIQRRYQMVELIRLGIYMHVFAW